MASSKRLYVDAAEELFRLKPVPGTKKGMSKFAETERLDTWKQVVVAIGSAFARDNAAFKASVFREACGYDG